MVRRRKPSSFSRTLTPREVYKNRAKTRKQKTACDTVSRSVCARKIFRGFEVTIYKSDDYVDKIICFLYYLYIADFVI